MHPNAPAFATSEEKVSRCLRSVVKVVKFLDDRFRRVKELKARVKVLHAAYDANQLNAKRVTAMSEARPLVASVLQRICRLMNWMRGRVDANVNRKGTLDVVDLRWRVNRLLLSLVLQEESNGAPFVHLLALVPKGAHVAPSASETLRPEAANLSKVARIDFVRSCYESVREAASKRNWHRYELLEQFEVDQRQDHWKNKLAEEFQQAMESALKTMSGEAQLALSKQPPEALLQVTSRAMDGSLVLDLAKLCAPPVAPGLVKRTVPEKGPWSRRYRADGFVFVPKQPRVKLVPDMGSTIGHMLVSREVGVELLVRALRAVVEDRNLLLLGDVNRQDAVAVLGGAVRASFSRQRDHFRKGAVEGTKDGLEAGLKKSFASEVQPQTVAGDESMSKSLLLSLLDWGRVVHPRHRGKLIASSDGVGVNLVALPKKKMQSGFGGAESNQDPNLCQELGLFSVGGIDYGKSGAVAMIAPHAVQAALHEKAAAEAQLAHLLELKEKLPGLYRDALEEQDAVLDELGVDWTPPLERRYVLAEWEAVDAYERLLSIDGEVEAARQRVVEATLLEDQARALLATNRNKGMQCVTKAQKAVELNEKRLRDERERRLGIFAECLRGNDVTHHTLQQSVQSLHHAGAGKEVEAVASRLGVFRLLQIAHSSGSVRQQRRTTDKLKRNYVARFTRTVTKVLPEEVAKAGDSFLERNVVFPARSPHSRARERVRGWERGTHVALERIASADDCVPLGPLRLSCDMFTTKGQRVTSSYFFASLHRSMCRLIKTSPLAKRITVLIENGYRSSRQAAGLLSYLANLDRCNHRKVRANDVASAWQGPLVGSFKWFYCPITRKLVKRDPPAALSMVVIGTCSLHNAPRPNFFCPQSSD